MASTAAVARYPLDQLRDGRLFVYGRLRDPVGGGPLYCRVADWGEGVIRYDHVYGGRHLGRWTEPYELFFSSTLGGWCDDAEGA